MSEPRPALSVSIDGVLLPADDARALWQRFSDWMEDHRGDLAGFATKEGFASIHPGVQNGRPILVASKGAARQLPYAVAQVVDPQGGSRARSPAAPSPQGGRRSKKNPGRNT
jgi:hypothetical protein